jgi:hypothetical protein
VKKQRNHSSGKPRILAAGDLIHLDSRQRLSLLDKGECVRRRDFLKKVLSGAAVALSFPALGSSMITGPSSENGASKTTACQTQNVCCACDADLTCKCQNHTACTCQADTVPCTCEGNAGCKCESYEGACASYGSFVSCNCHSYNPSACSAYTPCTCQNQCACQSYNACTCDPQCTCQGFCGYYGCVCEVQCACQLDGVCTSY